MDYLRVILEKGVTCMDPVKGAGIKTWPTPTNIMEVQKVLGFLNFYHPFIKGFAHIAYPLHKLTCKGYEWQWGKEKQDAFKQLKQLVTEEPVLAHADLEEQFEVEVDVLGYTVGAVLLQHKEDGKMHPLGYYLAMLNVAQWNYDIYNLNCWQLWWLSRIGDLYLQDHYIRSLYTLTIWTFSTDNCHRRSQEE